MDNDVLILTIVNRGFFSNDEISIVLKLSRIFLKYQNKVIWITYKIRDNAFNLFLLKLTALISSHSFYKIIIGWPMLKQQTHALTFNKLRIERIK
jgi:hypothetical protein